MKGVHATYTIPRDADIRESHPAEIGNLVGSFALRFAIILPGLLHIRSSREPDLFGYPQGVVRAIPVHSFIRNGILSERKADFSSVRN